MKPEDENYWQNINDEVEHLRKTGIPRCAVCHKNLVNAIDSKTKEISPYLWRTDCGHTPDLRIGIG